MRKYACLLIIGTLFVACMGTNNSTESTDSIKGKLMDKLEGFAARLEEQEKRKDSLDLIEARKQIGKDKIKMVPPPEWSVMRLMPEIPSAEDLVAGNTAEYLSALEKFKEAAYDVYDHFTDSISHNRAQLARFGHTQAELDAMSEDEKNATAMKAYNKMKEEQAVREQVVKEEAAKLDASSLGGMLKSMAQLKQREEQAAEDAKNKFFTDNADILPLIDEYHKTSREFNQWLNVTEDEKHYEFFEKKGVARMELWRQWYIEVQQKFHQLAPLAREADRNMLQVKMPAKKSRETSLYDFMNEFNLNRHYYEFMKSITEKSTE